MAKIVISDILDTFVKPVSEGGYGIPDSIVGYMTELRSYTTSQLYASYKDDSGLSSDAKALDYVEFKKVIEWMIGKEFDGKTVTNQLGLVITYNQDEAFGVEDIVDGVGIDNGDGTRTVDLTAWKPVGAQHRWGVATPVASVSSDQFSAINDINATFTGDKGIAYILLMTCFFDDKLQTKKFNVSLAS
jgi:hypothetical protein